MKFSARANTREQRSWRGQVTAGTLAGHVVEVRASGEPLPIYTIAYREGSGGPSKLMGFAVGTEALRRHFEEQEAEIAWELPALSRVRSEGAQDPSAPGHSPKAWAS
jgi:hypothetical protein